MHAQVCRLWLSETPAARSSILFLLHHPDGLQPDTPRAPPFFLFAEAYPTMPSVPRYCRERSGEGFATGHRLCDTGSKSGITALVLNKSALLWFRIFLRRGMTTRHPSFQLNYS